MSARAWWVVGLMLAACATSPSRPPSRAVKAPAVGKTLAVSDPAYGVGLPTTLTMGDGFVCATDAAGRARCWGSNGSGQLGHGDRGPKEGPVIVPTLRGVVEVAAGAQHACARKDDGTVWCWGEGDGFRLGRKLAKGVHRPLRVEEVSHAVALAVGTDHSCAVLRDGTARCWGSYERGKLGLDHVDHVTEPANVAMDVADATGVALGQTSTCVRTATGEVFCWGVGDELDANEKLAIEGVEGATRLLVDGSRTCALLKEGAPTCWGEKASAKALKEVPREAIAFARDGECVIDKRGLTCPVSKDPEVCRRWV